MSRFQVGDLLTVRMEEGSLSEALQRTPLWEGTYAVHGVIDSLRADEELPVVFAEDSRGWVRVLSPRGKLGWVNRDNVACVFKQNEGHSVE